jgi:hypothetical protein
LDPVEKSIRIPVTDINAQADFYDDTPELVVSVCSLYHFCRILIHASMVPILSGSMESTHSREFVQQHADAALQQAVAYANLLQQIIIHDLDVTRLWPLSGYGAFVAARVLLVCILQRIIVVELVCADDLPRCFRYSKV